MPREYDAHGSHATQQTASAAVTEARALLAADPSYRPSPEAELDPTVRLLAALVDEAEASARQSRDACEAHAWGVRELEHQIKRANALAEERIDLRRLAERLEAERDALQGRLAELESAGAETRSAVAEARRLLAAATPGPLYAWHDDAEGAPPHHWYLEDEHEGIVADGLTAEDAALFAATRRLLAALANEVTALRAQIVGALNAAPAKKD